jgi:large subunit ribosomal protein L25
MTSQIELAKTLPPRLLRFFQRFPPPQLFPTITQQIAATPADSTVSTPATVDAPTLTEATATTPEDVSFPNPFLPTKNFTTGRWHGPVYGLRKQADLVKLANAHGVVDLLPWTIKKPGEKEARRIERGLAVKGTGEGQRVKGKLWERTLKGRLEMRRQAMLDMPRLIQEWKQVSRWMHWGVVGTTDSRTERTRSWVEEVAQREGEEIEGSKRLGLELEFWAAVYLCTWMGAYSTAFRQDTLLCIISGRARVRDDGERCNNISTLIICKSSNYSVIWVSG